MSIFAFTERERNWHLVPEHLRGGVKRYLEHGVPPGDFLTAVLENNLMEAVGRADEHSLAGLKGLCSFLYCDVPRLCRGSSERVEQWIKWGGIEGLKKGENDGKVSNR